VTAGKEWRRQVRRTQAARRAAQRRHPASGQAQPDRPGMIRLVPAQPDRQPPVPTEETPMPDKPGRVAALRAQLLDELAHIDAAIELADARSRNGADPLATIAAQEARQTRDRIRGLLGQLGQLGQLDDLGRITDLVLDDPAVQAAGDQLHAAWNGPPPGLDHDTWQQGQHDAQKVIARSAARHAADQLGIPADQLPRALEIADRIVDEAQTDE
jgi:hypothetical protein